MSIIGYMILSGLFNYKYINLPANNFYFINHIAPSVLHKPIRIDQT